MLRALELGLARSGLARRHAVLGVIAIGGAIVPLIVRARGRYVAKPAKQLEVSRLELSGASYGAVYEDGRLIGLIEGVHRL